MKEFIKEGLMFILMMITAGVIIGGINFFFLLHLEERPDRAHFLKACGYKHIKADNVWVDTNSQPDYSLLFIK